MNGIIKSLAIVSIAICSTITIYAKDLVGESASYELDRSRQRTTGMIKRGEVDAMVADFLPNDPNGPSYLVNLRYDLKVSFVGNKQGELGLSATQDFFTPEFLERLRNEKEISEPKFKIRHIGFGDAQLKGGHSYPSCDIVEIYDIDTTQANSFNILGLAYSILQEAAIQAGPGAAAEIEDMMIKAYVCANIPVIGAAKIDMTGKTSGYNFKAGFDYVVP
ncbi:MAG: hypothetical protein KDD61_14470 [Bdellovibrionales bacterium]|nr:hypothetical protein [Bdellovibrionales bacterium]